MSKILLLAASCLAAPFMAAPAWAQQSPDPQAEGDSSTGLDEITVTATKREQNLQSVSLSITAVTGELLQERGVETLDQVTQYTPNVLIAGVDGPAKYVSIRGLGSGNNRGFETSVGLFLDGVYLGREVFLFDSYIDIGRIEAIKGPQGALFGKNTIAGAISVVTARPTSEFSGELAGTVGENSKKAFSAVVSGPLASNLDARLSAEYFDRGGYVEDTVTGSSDGSRRVASVRAKFDWRASDALRFQLTGQYSDLENHGTGRQLAQSVACVSFAPAARCAPANVSHPATAGGTRSLLSIIQAINPAAENNIDYRRTSGPAPDGESRATLFTALQSDLEIGDHTLTYIGSYAEIINQRTDLDPDATLFNGGLLVNSEDYSQQSHELRLTSPSTGFLTYIAGAYLFKSKVAGFQQFQTALGNLNANVDQDTRSISLFAQATMNVSGRLRAIGGVRYIEEDKDARLRQVGIAALGFPNYDRNEIFKDNKVLLNGAIEFDLADRILLYGSYAQGYKAGGFNFFDLRNTVPVYGAETSEGFELGLKNTLFDNRVRFNVAAFTTRFDNLQTSFFNGTANVVGNAASAHSKGIEVELNWKVTDQLQLNASGAILSARFTNFATAPCTISQQLNSPTTTCTQNLGGKPLERAPNFTGVFNATYKVPIGKLELSVAADVAYTSSYYTSADLDVAGLQDKYPLFNGRIALSHPDAGWSLAIIGRNLANKAYAYVSANTFQFAGTRFAHIGEGRQIDVQLKFKW